jgi:hypothetical protein
MWDDDEFMHSQIREKIDKLVVGADLHTDHSRGNAGAPSVS